MSHEYGAGSGPGSLGKVDILFHDSLETSRESVSGSGRVPGVSETVRKHARKGSRALGEVGERDD